MWAISQENPTTEITHFERVGLNDLFSNPFNLAREWVVKKEKSE